MPQEPSGVMISLFVAGNLFYAFVVGSRIFKGWGDFFNCFGYFISSGKEAVRTEEMKDCNWRFLKFLLIVIPVVILSIVALSCSSGGEVK